MRHNDFSTQLNSDDLSQSDLFRRGRLAMGWSPAMLARTLLVTESVVLNWEDGLRPIPMPVLEWVAMYAYNPSDVNTDESPTTSGAGTSVELGIDCQG